MLCYRALLASQISRAGLYHVINRLKGTLIVDEVEDLARLNQSGFDMAVILHGYKRGGFVVRVDAAKRRPIRFDCFGPKVLANTGGIASKQLKSRCIVIKTVHADRQMDRFIRSRDEKALKELALGIANIFKRKTLREQIAVLNEKISPLEGLPGRDFELWVGMLIISQLIDSQATAPNLFDHVVKIAIANAEKREEDSFFLDWNIKFLLSTANFLSLNPYGSNDYIQADQITKHVVEEVKPPFRLRTEGLGKILDRESLLRVRRVRWFKDENGNAIHRTGWIIEVDRLKNRVRKYQKYIQPYQESPDPQIRSIDPIADIFEEVYPNLGKN